MAINFVEKDYGEAGLVITSPDVKYLHCFAGSDVILLDGRFTVADLESIVAKIKSHLTQRAPDAPKRGAKVVKSKSKKVAKSARR